jgi:hypothetical protein
MKKVLFFFLAMGLLAGTANAKLIDRGGGLIYDTDLNITWLQDANLAATNTFGLGGYILGGGLMDWNTAQAWISAMNAANYLGFSNWRLPTTTPGTTLGYTSGGEMGHLYYTELANSAGGPLTQTGPFIDLQPVPYWTSTVYAPDPINAWYFNFFFVFGSQGANLKYNDLYVWPVRDGDVVQTVRSVKKGVLSNLTKFLAQTTNQHDTAEVKDAIQHMQKSLDPSLWVDDHRLSPKYGEKVFNEEETVVQDLNELLNRGVPVQDFINSLLEADKLLAQIAINDAIAAQGHPKDIAKAQGEMAKAIEEVIEHYGEAWDEAMKALK